MISPRRTIWHDFAAAGHIPSAGIRSVWGSSVPYERSFLFDAYGSGWHVDRRAVDAALAAAAEQRGVQVRRRWQLLGCEATSDSRWLLQLSCPDGTSALRTRVLVDATGRRSTLVRRFGGSRIAHDRLIGMFGYFSGSTGEVDDGYTLIEAVEDGWWYSAPLPRGRLVVAFMSDADVCAHAALRRPQRWETHLRRAPHTRARTAGLVRRGPLRAVAANSSLADRVGGEGWLAVGDAAAAHDPLSGDGVYRALEAGERAAPVIASISAGDEGVLHEYEREHRHLFDLYLSRRGGYYSRERRWADAPFWARRTGLRRGPQA